MDPHGELSKFLHFLLPPDVRLVGWSHKYREGEYFGIFGIVNASYLLIIFKTFVKKIKGAILLLKFDWNLYLIIYFDELSIKTGIRDKNK